MAPTASQMAYGITISPNPFSRIPVEIRLRIWGLALTNTDGVIDPVNASPYPGNARTGYFCDYRSVSIGRMAKSMSLACRLIKDDLEVYNILYKVNHFNFSSLEGLADFVVAITPYHRRALRHVSVACFGHVLEEIDRPDRPSSPRPAGELNKLLTLLRECTGLQDLEMTLYDGTQGIRPDHALEVMTRLLLDSIDLTSILRLRICIATPSHPLYSDASAVMTLAGRQAIATYVGQSRVLMLSAAVTALSGDEDASTVLAERLRPLLEAAITRNLGRTHYIPRGDLCARIGAQHRSLLTGEGRARASEDGDPYGVSGRTGS